MLSLILLAALAQPQVTPPGAQAPTAPTTTGMAPDQGVATIDAKGNLTITRIESIPTPCGPGLMNVQEVWLKAPPKKDTEKVQVKAKVMTMQLNVVELPANIVEAYTVDGKLIAAPRLADLLAKERTVLIALDGKKVDAFHLQLYKEGTIVLVPPANLWSGSHGLSGGYGPPTRYYGGYPYDGGYPGPYAVPEKMPSGDRPNGKKPHPDN